MWLKDDRIVFHPSYNIKNMQNQPSFILPGLERDRCKNKVPLWFDRSEKKLDEKKINHPIRFAEHAITITSCPFTNNLLAATFSIANVR